MGIKINNVSYNISKEDTFKDIDIKGIQNVDLNIGETDAGEEMMNRATSLREAFKEVEKLLDTIVKDFHTGNEAKIKEHIENFQIVRQKLKEIEEKDTIRNFQPPISGDIIIKTFNIKLDNSPRVNYQKDLDVTLLIFPS